MIALGFISYGCSPNSTQAGLKSVIPHDSFTSQIPTGSTIDENTGKVRDSCGEVLGTVNSSREIIDSSGTIIGYTDLNGNIIDNRSTLEKILEVE